MNVFFKGCQRAAIGVLLVLSGQSVAQSEPAEVTISALGALNLRYAEVSLASDFAGQPLLAQASAYTGSARPVGRMIESAEMTWLAQPGSVVEAGQPVMQLAGSEVHHFLTEYDARKSYFQLVKKRYDDNQQLFKQKAIGASAWQEISLAYQAAMLEFEHLDHFYERISQVSADHSSIILTAPIAGLVLSADASEPVLFSILDQAQLRLTGTLVEQSFQPSAIRFENCQLAIERFEAVSEGFSRRWWTAPVASESACQLNWQQQLNVTPVYAQAVYRVPTSAIVRHHSQQHLWLKSVNSLRLVPVSILGKDAGAFWVQSEALAPADQVLIQSVSAVYGHYLGLGGE
ncbi:hypothetical protein JAO78_013695 [Alishewanella sp. 16-MA]|uniref:RND efflux pump membrane fusion protein barrel-sandwich domain-containing protein n=1 Tax=Alishewanella maricola TaxID=2795740 RepID=A0ABS8C699_9ALTE|nr:hypothetical protein [Alishewanella maricola]MCB5227866.1 hypothetical protein [Alishewanella maricola]